MIYIEISKMEAAAAMRADLVGDPKGIIAAVATDSRKLVTRADVLFFCLRGARHDGHTFVSALYARGIRLFVIEAGRVRPEEFPGADFLVTPDTTRALQDLAQKHRLSNPVMRCIGITGSNGKTIVKEWLSRMISEELRTVRSPGSYNSQIGVALALLHIGNRDQVGLFEAGISQPGEMTRLNEIMAPDSVIFTNVGMAHLENFADKQSLANEKAKLALGANQVIYCSDYPEWDRALSGFSGVKTTWSAYNPSADFYFQTRPVGVHETAVTLTFKSQKLHFNLPVTDPGSVENAMTVITAAMTLGLTPERITERTDRFTPPAWRMELIEAANGCLLLSDVYNADLTSLASTLDFANAHRHGRKLTLVLTDLLQSGIPSAELYARAAHLLSDKQVQRFVGIGAEISKHANLFPPDARFFPDTETALMQADLAFNDEMVVFKGARPFRLERLVESHALQSHQTTLTINLDALEQNLNALKSLSGPQTGCIAVVKAAAYGSGSVEVASVLEFNRVDYLAVAYADEGVRLREAGISTPIVVLNMVFGTHELLIKHRLEPEIFSFSGLKSFIASLQKETLKEPFPIHIKLDTGMHRLGFLPEEWTRLGQMLKENEQWVRVSTCFSHLAAADNPTHDTFTREQIALFVRGAYALEKILGYAIQRHIANTSAVLRFPESRLDLVRFGIGLYGVGDDRLLQPVHRLLSVISQIKQIKAGDSVSYDRSFVADHDMTIGILAAGYADGFPRALSNGKVSVWVNGKQALVIGKICMDMTIIDLTNIEAREGDSVELFGVHNTLRHIADASDRIPYEILSNIPARVKRVYVRAG